MNFFDESTYRNILNQLCSMSGIDSDKLNEKLAEDKEFASLFYVVMNRYNIDYWKVLEGSNNKKSFKNSEEVLKKNRRIRELYVNAIRQIEKINISEKWSINDKDKVILTLSYLGYNKKVIPVGGTRGEKIIIICSLQGVS